MAGENIPMGIGSLGFSNMIFKRKFRFTFELADICNKKGGASVPPDFVKIAARPSLTVEETEINHLNARTWIPGKGYWETITVTYIDVADDAIQPLFSWLASVYDFTNSYWLKQGSSANEYAGTAIIKMWDGCGDLLEKWELKNAWPTSVNFGDLDYANSEEATIELTLRYSDVEYTNVCPGMQIGPCCDGCNGPDDTDASDILDNPIA